MKIVRPLAVLAIVALLLPGCGLPISVRRVDDPKADAEGVRYTLRSPSYSAALRLKDEGAYDRYELILSQSLDGRPVTYEVETPRWHLLHLFAETNLTLTLAGKEQAKHGRLSAFSGGVTDRTHEVVEALAGLAVKAGGGAAAAEDERLREIRAYDKEHRALLKARDKTKTKLHEARAAFPPDDPSQLPGLDKRIATLTKRLTSLETVIAAHRLPLRASEYSLTLVTWERGVERVLKITDPKKPWLKIRLEPWVNADSYTRGASLR